MAIDSNKPAKKDPAGSAHSASGTPAQTAAGNTTQNDTPTPAPPVAGTPAPPPPGAPIAAAPGPSAPSDPPPTRGTGSCGKTVLIGFYDASTLAQLSPADGTELEFQTADGDSCGSVTLTQNKNNHYYSVSLPTDLPAPTPNPTEDDETLCDTPATVETDLVALTSASPMVINCQSYFMPSIAIAVNTSEKNTNPTAPPAGLSLSPKAADSACAINIPLTRFEESYTAKFFAFDSCFKDYILNAKALVNHVTVTATPVKTRSTGTATAAQPTRVTARTVDGFAELPGLIPHQLYRIEVNGPKDYVCVQPPHPYLCNPTAKSVKVTALFQPCGRFPARSVIFVQQDYPGMRVPKLNLQAGGQPVFADEHGIWNVPTGTTGVVEFQAMGKSFSPASIDLNSETDVAFMVGVADQTATHSTRTGGRRFYFLDEKGEPFKRRKLHLRADNGNESTIFTDPSDGSFDADEGWLAWADEDESGHAVAAYPLLIGKV